MGISLALHFNSPQVAIFLFINCMPWQQRSQTDMPSGEGYFRRWGGGREGPGLFRVVDVARVNVFADIKKLK